MASIEERLAARALLTIPDPSPQLVASALAPEVRAIVADELETLAEHGRMPRNGQNIVRQRAAALRSVHS